MAVSICRFCGVATAVPHETQALCIEALHVEIDRTRQIISGRREHRCEPRHPPHDERAAPDRKKATQAV